MKADGAHALGFTIYRVGRFMMGTKRCVSGAWRAFGICAVAAALGCAGTRPLPDLELPSLIAPLPEQRAVEPQRLIYPVKPGRVLFSVPLADGFRLLSTDQRVRWIEATAGGLRAAEEAAPEPLIAGELSASGVWLFVGLSGATYSAERPLGALTPLTRSPLSSHPDAELVRTVAIGNAIAGVGKNGSLWNSQDFGRTWQSWSADTRFVDVALRPDGVGLALSVPESLWGTDDFGKTWNRVSVETRGITTLGAEAERITARGLFESFFLVVDKTGYSFEVDAASSQETLAEPLPVGPDAGAIRSGVAAWSIGPNPRYAQVTTDRRARASELVVLLGKRGEALTTTPLKLMAAEGQPLDQSQCQHFQLAGGREHWYLACSETDNEVAKVSFFSSRTVPRTGAASEGPAKSKQVGGFDGAFVRLPISLYADFSRFRWQPLSGERVVVSGVCGSLDSSRGCEPYGVHLLELGVPVSAAGGAVATGRPSSVDSPQAKPSSELFAPLSIPDFDGTALGLARAPDSDNLAVLTIPNKTGRLVLHTTQEPLSGTSGGRFVATELPDVATTQHHGGRPPRAEQLSLDAHGLVSLSVKRFRGEESRPFLIDPGAQPGAGVQEPPPPFPGVETGWSGQRGIAWKPDTGQLWFSHDGGGSWAAVPPVPPDACAESRNGCAMQCQVDGCVLGKGASLLSWNFESPVAGFATAQESVGAEPTEADRKLQSGAPIQCVVDDTVPWARLAQARPPGADHAVFAATEWFVPVVEPATGGLQAAMMTSSGLRSVELFAPSSGASRAPAFGSARKGRNRRGGMVFVPRLQVEGLVAARQLPGSPVELAWLNLMESDTVRRVSIPGELRASDVGGTSERSEFPFLSVVGGGVFAQLAATSPLYFVPNKGQIRPVEAPRWPKSSLRGQSEPTRIAGHNVWLKLVGSGVAIGSQDGASFSARATGPSNPNAFGIQLRQRYAYLDGDFAINTLFYSRQKMESWLLPLTAADLSSIQPQQVPAITELGEAPQACTDSVLSGLRLVASGVPKTRHPVKISDSTEPIDPFATTDALLQGKRGTPCVAAFGASPLKGDSGATSALVIPSTERRSWLFRGGEAPRSRPVLEYRPMSCAYGAVTASP